MIGRPNGRTHLHCLVVVACALGGCGGDDSAADAGHDARFDGGADAAWAPTPVSPAAGPVFTPCPPGWREMEPGAPGSPRWCDPWPEGGPQTCADGQAHRPGEPSCSTVGAECATDGWPVDLPSDVPVIFVAAGSSAGDGSRAAPWATVSEAIGAAPDGATIAISTGRYEEVVAVTRPMTLRGACAETILSSDSPVATLDTSAEGVVVRDLRVVGAVHGVWVRSGSLVLSGIIVEDIARTALIILAGSINAEDLLIRRIGETAVNVGAGAHVVVRRAVIEDIGVTGLLPMDGDLDMEDVVMRGVGAGMADTDLLLAIGRCAVRLDRFVADESVTQRFFLLGMSSLRLTHGVIASLGSASPTLEGGIIGFDGSTLEIRKTRMERSRSVAIAAVELGTSLDAQDVWIRDVRPGAATGGGNAIEIGTGASAVLERVQIERAEGFALLADGPGTTAAVSDLRALDTRSSARGTFGRALQVQSGAHLTGTRVEARGNREASVVAAGLGTRVELLDLGVYDTWPASCVEPCEGAGVGVGSYLGASLTAQRFIVNGNALAGLQIARVGSIDLADGTVSDNPVGANLQVPDYDVTRISNQVIYERNGVNLDATALPVPDPTPPP